MKKLSLLLAAVMLFGLLSGCGGEKKDLSTISVEDVYPWNVEGIADSSDIPDWTGETLEMTYWMGHGVGADIYKNMSKDVVTPEIERITGIKFDHENRVDNAGQNFDVKLSMLMASDDFPNFVYQPQSLNKLIEADAIYDLKPYIEKYCPNIIKKYPESIFDEIYNLNNGDSSTMYAVPTGVGGDYLNSLEDFDLSRLSRSGIEHMGYVYVRDDILKMIYPEAKTQDEIEEIYIQKGSFTEEEILDVQINSYEEFVQFLRKIRELDIKEGSRQVYPTYAFTGGDNWNIMQCMWYALDGRGSYSNYMFTYWDAASKRIELALTQDFFKNSLHIWNQLVRDDVVSPDSLIDNADVFREKLDNGLYAVTSQMDIPNEEVLKAAGKSFRYRKVYLNIPMNKEKFVPIRQSNFGINPIAVFKSSTTEEELIQLLRCIDFCVSDIGEKLQSWGPRSAGLWEEVDGKRVFVDEEVEKHIVYGEDNDAKEYNLMGVNSINASKPSNEIPIVFAYQNMTKHHPAYVYDRIRSKSDAMNVFSIGNVVDFETVYAITPDIWSFVDESEKAKKAWGNRANVENALTTILASADEADFNKNYESLIQILEQCGWTQEMLDEINVLYEDMNKDYIDDLRKYN